MTPIIERLVSPLGPPFRSAFDVLSAIEAQHGPARLLNHAQPSIARLTRRQPPRKRNALHVDDVDDIATGYVALLLVEDWKKLPDRIKRLTDWILATETGSDCEIDRAGRRLNEAMADAQAWVDTTTERLDRA